MRNTDTCLPEDVEFLNGASTARTLLNLLGRPDAIRHFERFQETAAQEIDFEPEEHQTPAFWNGFHAELELIRGTA